MKFRILTILVISISVVKCDKKEDFDKNRIQKRSYYHHPGAINDVNYHIPGAVPLAANPFLFKPHHDPTFIKPFGLAPPHILPAAAPAPVLPANRFVPGDAWVTQHSVTYPRVPVLQAPVVPTAPLAPTHPFVPTASFVPSAPVVPQVIHAPALKPFAFAPPPVVSYVPVPKPVLVPRPVVAPAFVPTAVAVKPIVPVLPPHHHHVAVQPTVSSENPENPPINIPEDQRPNMPDIEETESPTTSDQSTHTHNTIPYLPAGLPPTFVMQIGTSSSGIDTSAFTPQSPAQPSNHPAPFAPSSPPRESFGPFAPRPPSNSFTGMVPQMMPVFMQMMGHHHHGFPEEPENSFNFHPHSASVASSYGPPPQNYGSPLINQRLRNHHVPNKQFRKRPNNRHRKPQRLTKKLKYTIIKHHHDRK